MAQIAPNQLAHLKAHQALFDEHQQEKDADIEQYMVDSEDEDGPGSAYERLCGDLGIEPVLATTPRGFGIYTDFRDKYGSRVRVQQSSLATDDCVWIFATDNPEIREPSPHLTVAQAKVVRDALDRFIKENS